MVFESKGRRCFHGVSGVPACLLSFVDCASAGAFEVLGHMPAGCSSGSNAPAKSRMSYGLSFPELMVLDLAQRRFRRHFRSYQ
jgi:hypothetical protein